MDVSTVGPCDLREQVLVSLGHTFFWTICCAGATEDDQPRQRTICTLGRLEPGGDVDVPGCLRAMAVSTTTAMRSALGTRLATLMRPMIHEGLSVVVYNLTTVEVAGEAVVARQFMLSLVQASEGLPIAQLTRCTRETSQRPRRCWR